MNKMRKNLMIGATIAAGLVGLTATNTASAWPGQVQCWTNAWGRHCRVIQPVYPGGYYPGRYYPGGYYPGRWCGPYRCYYGPRYYGPRYYGPRYYGPRYYGPQIIIR